MKYTRIISCIALILFSFSYKYTSAQNDVTAIDVLLDPDHTMLDSAKVYNSLLQKDYSGPGSFSLDATHNPHISVLQCFVRTTDLNKVFAAVNSVAKKEKPTKEIITTSGFYYIPNKGLGLAGITATPTPKLLRFQTKIIEALKPFMVAGTDAAFVQNPNGAPIVAGLTEYVNGFVANSSEDKFNPHVTIGLAHEAFLNELKAKPYNKFTFQSKSISIYQLGDFGTAQKKLWTSIDK